MRNKKIVKLEDTRERIEVLEKIKNNSKIILILFNNSAKFTYSEALERRDYNIEDFDKIGLNEEIAKSYFYDHCMIFEERK